MEPTISALWFVQPYILHELISNPEAIERGLTARLLIFDAKAEPEEDDGIVRHILPEMQSAWENIINRILTKRENSADPKLPHWGHGFALSDNLSPQLEHTITGAPQ